MVEICEFVLDAVADILLERDDVASRDLLRSFEDFVATLSADSKLPPLEVQSRLIEKMLLNPRRMNLDGNVIRFDDYLHLVAVN